MSQNEEEGKKEEVVEDVEDSENILELPSSWVDPLIIEGDAFRLRYPGGEKSSSYHKATVENFAVNSARFIRFY